MECEMRWMECVRRWMECEIPLSQFCVKDGEDLTLQQLLVSCPHCRLTETWLRDTLIPAFHPALGNLCG